MSRLSRGCSNPDMLACFARGVYGLERGSSPDEASEREAAVDARQQEAAKDRSALWSAIGTYSDPVHSRRLRA